MINTRGGRLTNLRTILFYLRAANNRRGFKSVMIPLLSEQQLGDVRRYRETFFCIQLPTKKAQWRNFIKLIEYPVHRI
jgi:hypothetical protein